jgi:beta-galactosidase
VGRYAGTVEEQYFPFIRPGECGGKSDTRWAALLDHDNKGFMFVGAPHFQFSALHYSAADLENAKRYYDLSPRPEIYVHIDGFHMGLGGDDGWTCNVHDEYLIKPGQYSFVFAIASYQPDKVDAIRNRLRSHLST